MICQTRGVFFLQLVISGLCSMCIAEPRGGQARQIHRGTVSVITCCLFSDFHIWISENSFCCGILCDTSSCRKWWYCHCLLITGSLQSQPVLDTFISSFNHCYLRLCSYFFALQQASQFQGKTVFYKIRDTKYFRVTYNRFLKCPACYKTNLTLQYMRRSSIMFHRFIITEGCGKLLSK